jgi:DNA sulfur modification protein DndD
MVIESITIKNLGVYAGEVSLDLQPKSPEQPVVLIGGLNGRGKTTLRNSILLCLHGDNARCSNRKGLGYKQYLESLISRNAKKDESTSIALTYHRKVAGRVQRLQIKRHWEKINGEIHENFTVHIMPNDNAMEIDRTLATNWNEHIESYFPASLANLFFFDGEDISRLSNPKEIQKLIQSALSSLLGLNIIDRLELDLTRYIKELIDKSEGSDEQVAFQKTEEDLRNVLAEHNLCQKNLDEAELANRKMNKNLDEAKQRYIDKGGELEEQSKSLQLKEQNLVLELETLREKYRALAEGPGFLQLVEPLLKMAHKQALVEYRIRKSAELVEHDIERDEEIIKRISEIFDQATELKKIKEVLDSTRAKQSKSSEVILNSDDKLERILSHTVGHVLPSEKNNFVTFISEFRAKELELEQVRENLTNVPDAQLISLLREKKNQATHACETAKVRLDYCQERLHESAARLVRAQNAREIAESTFRGLKEIRTKKLRAEQARETIRQFRTTTTNKKLDQISDLISDAFCRLIGKKSLIKNIKINQDTFGLILTKPGGENMPYEQLSRGESQIMAFAVLWGLSKASGRPLPTVIDTPLSRLDNTNRVNVAENYFHQASHQVIILSTDTEIVGEIFEKMKPGIGKKFSLTFNDETHSTLINTGYFA